MERGIRNNAGKPKWSLVDFKAFEPMVQVLEYGAEKVGKSNWRKGLLVTEIAESLLRHTFSLLDGEDNDKESGLPHVGHILSNAMFLSYMLANRPDMDDREKKVKPKNDLSFRLGVNGEEIKQAMQDLAKELQKVKVTSPKVEFPIGGYISKSQSPEFRIKSRVDNAVCEGVWERLNTDVPKSSFQKLVGEVKDIQARLNAEAKSVWCGGEEFIPIDIDEYAKENLRELVCKEGNSTRVNRKDGWITYMVIKGKWMKTVKAN